MFYFILFFKNFFVTCVIRRLMNELFWVVVVYLSKKRESVKRVRMSTACTFIRIKKIKSKKGKILIAYFPFRNVYKMQTFRVNYFMNGFTSKL